MLVGLGYKEIEVAFPSASRADYTFTRRLIETPGAVPTDVWLQVLSPCREDLIRQTIDAVKGGKKVIIHIYLATSECFRNVVFNFSKEESIELAVRSTKLIRSLTKGNPDAQDTEWAFEFSPETFSDTDPDFALRICEAVKAAWEPTFDNKIIFNLPATVEVSTPNVYADQIEYFCQNISERGKVCVSLHPHNDRGCAVAAAEQGQMAGADRVEGCLFGNGERTGNVDLVTLGLNLYTQGIPPNVDFSNMESIVEVVEECNKIPVPQRAPYGGSLVFTAFSGSHQDAIKKGFKQRIQDEDSIWELPYLPIDPKDIGRTYDAVIRVNSQSGKGGASWVILQQLGLDLPRELQIIFSGLVQSYADRKGRELHTDEIVRLFKKEFYLTRSRVQIVEYSFEADWATMIYPPVDREKRMMEEKQVRRLFEGVIAIDGRQYSVRSHGRGLISALTNALEEFGLSLEVKHSERHSCGSSPSTAIATYLRCGVVGSLLEVWGVGIDEDAAQSAMKALLSAASNVIESGLAPTPPLKSEIEAGILSRHESEYSMPLENREKQCIESV